MDLTNKQNAVELLKSSESDQDWSDNVDAIQAANGGGYPPWWYQEVIATGLPQAVADKWQGDAGIEIVLAGPRQSEKSYIGSDGRWVDPQ